MQIRPFALTISCLLCVVAATGDEAQKPSLSFNKLHHDFGKIASDRKVSYNYKATNDGKTPVQIRQVVPSCGCSSTMLGQWYLKPGESTELQAIFDPTGRRGAQRKSIQVIYDAGGDSQVGGHSATLTFEADVIQEIMASKTAIFFDDVLRSAPQKDSIRLQSGTGEQVKVTDIKIPGAPYLTATQRTEGKDVWVDVIFDGKKVPGGRSNNLDTLSIHTTNQRMSVINVDVQWNLRPVIKLSPSRIAWVDSAGKELKATLTLEHADGKAFKILSAKPTHANIRVEGLGQKAASKQELVFSFSGKAKQGAYVEKVLLKVDDPEQSEVEVRVSAVIK